MILLVYFPLAWAGLIEEHSLLDEDLPTPLSLAASVAFCMFCEDFVFYWTHRLLHWRVLYPHIHKIHHTYKTTVSITSEYAHPIEYIFSNLAPSGAGPFLLGYRMHCLTVFAWYVVRMSETLDGHGGYEFSWSPFRLIPFSGSSEYHDWHHSENIGNYASFFCIWDTVFNTNHHYFKK